jgi:hypothetical protein
MTRAAKRGISNAAAMAACAVCLVAAAAIVMVPVLALAHRQADPPPLLHTPVDRVSIDVAWDAARASNVALADVFSQRSPACTDHLADIGRAGRLDAGSLLGAHVPAVVRQDASTGVAACATRDPMVVVRSRPGAGGHVAAIRAVDAVWHRAVTSTRLVWPVDALSHRLLVEPVVRSHVHRGESIALHADRLHDRAAQLTAAVCVSEPDSACGPSPGPEKWTLEVSDHFRFHFRGLFT